MRQGPLKRFLALVCLAALVLAGCAREPRRSTFVHRDLPNGITIITKENRASRVVAIQAWIRDGGLFETPDQAGAARLVASLMFSKTPSTEFGEIEDTIEALGGTVSVNPQKDFVEYSCVVPSEHFELTVELLTDGLENAVFDSAVFESRKAKVLRDIASRGSRPIDAAYELCLSEMLGEHPYGRPTRTTAESVQKVTLEEVRARYSERYVGANMLVVVAGDVDPVDAADLLEERLSGIESGQRAEPVVSEVEWPSRSSRVVREMDVKSAYQVVCFPAPGIRDRDSITMDILLMILKAGRSMRLHRILKEELGLVNSVDAQWYTLGQPSPLFVWMELPPDKVEEAERAVVEIFTDLAETPVSEGELGKAKTYWKTQILFMSETAEGQAFYEGYWTLLGWPGLPEEYVERLGTVTVEEVQRAAALYFGSGVHTTAVLTPGRGN